MSKTIIIGVSGPSSSGKTTLARLLRDIFQTPRSSLPASSLSTQDPQQSSSNQTDTNTTTTKPANNKLFIIHEDDFYKTDTLIPKRHVSSAQFGTREVDDWDCAESLDLDLLRRVLGHVKRHGGLPADFSSKEDRNSVGESGVAPHVVEKLREQCSGADSSTPTTTTTTLCLLDGFLLYPDPDSSPGSLERDLYDILTPLLDVKVFLPSTRRKTIDRRTKRIGYVTLEGFWEDPPGYVEDVVWPNYARDHAWLFASSDLSMDTVGDAVDAGRVDRSIASANGIVVGPGTGECHLTEILPWAVDQLKAVLRSGQT